MPSWTAHYSITQQGRGGEDVQKEGVRPHHSESPEEPSYVNRHVSCGGLNKNETRSLILKSVNTLKGIPSLHENWLRSQYLP